jgi:nitrogen fixation protein NifX
MKIAFASKDNVHVNQHFGWCEMFYIYEVFEDDYELISEVDSSLKFDDEIDKLEYKINCLEDSDIVYVSQIGPKAATMVQKCGIYPMKSSHEGEKIEDVIQSLQKMIQGNAPLWLKRILLKNQN